MGLKEKRLWEKPRLTWGALNALIGQPLAPCDPKAVPSLVNPVHELLTGQGRASVAQSSVEY